MAKKLDLIGQTFGYLTVMGDVPKPTKNRKLLCKCECGKVVEVFQMALRRKNKTYSCGCMTKKLISIKNRTHGLRKSPEYENWAGIKNRCLNPKNKNWNNYGGRGITICDRWINSFENFITDMGTRPFANAQIDRINNEEGYSPENCRWVTSMENNRNRRNNHILTFKGRSLCINEWSTITGITRSAIKYRLNTNMDIDDILTKPLRATSKNKGADNELSNTI